MLEVVTLEQAQELINGRFSSARTPSEPIETQHSLGRILASDIVGSEYLPPFDRSTVDGYAVRASDTFGASDSVPMLLTLAGTLEMGVLSDVPCAEGTCWAIPTGAALPPEANAVVMVEHCEIFSGDTIGIMKAVSPGENVLYRGDEVTPGMTLIPAETTLLPHHRGALDALGIKEVSAFLPPRVGIISTGNELISPDQEPQAGQIRDANGGLLADSVRAAGAIPISFGIVEDDVYKVTEALHRAVEQCDLVILSGGSSVGELDASFEACNQLGEVLLHGLSIKPGKPTLVTDIKGTPVFGLPGHPVAAYFVFLLLVRPLIASMQGASHFPTQRTARLTEAIPANHGRAEYVPVAFSEAPDKTLEANPIRIKSGLIALLATADGFIEVPRDCEGLPAGTPISVTLF